MAHVIDDVPSIQVALNKVKSDIGAVGKAERNNAQGFNFRGIDAVVNAAAPHLNAHGVITVPEVLETTYETVEIGQKRTAMGHVVLKVRYHFYGPAGDCISATVASESMDSGDKAMAKAMSVAYRIALLQVLNLPTCEPDPDSESYERSGQSAQNAVNSKSAKSEPEPISVDIAKVVKSAQTANSIDQLRSVYKTAGAAGVLLTEIADPATGEKMKFDAYLGKRADELNFRKSSNGAVAVGNASGSPE